MPKKLYSNLYHSAIAYTHTYANNDDNYYKNLLYAKVGTFIIVMILYVASGNLLSLLRPGD